MSEQPEQPSAQNATQDSSNSTTASKVAPSVSLSPPPSSKLIRTPKRVLVLMALVLLLGISIILWAWNIGPFHSTLEKTDNSYIKGKTTLLSSQINGYVQTVEVKDFDQVKHGQVLMHIDATPYNQKISQAQSGVTQAKNNLANQSQTIAQRRADIAAAQAKVEQAQAAEHLAVAQLRRYQQLGDSGAAARAEQDKALADRQNTTALLKQAQANLQVAQEALKTAQVAETGLQAQVNSAQALLDQAQTTKDYSTIIAPMDGQLGEVTPRIGQYVAAGTQLLYLIPKQTWVIANFKETQIAEIRIGQEAYFSVDALKHQKFTGRVDQISPAAGSEFSVLKPDNATGNFTKVVQRIAVRIAIDPDQAGVEQLRPGMSVVTTVDTQSQR